MPRSEATLSASVSSALNPPHIAAFLNEKWNVVFVRIIPIESIEYVIHCAAPQGDKLPMVASLFPCFAHSVSAALSLCLLAGYSEIAQLLVHSFGELDPTPTVLMQLDRFVRMLESPCFAFLRLRRLKGVTLDSDARWAQCMFATRTLTAVRAILPQGEAFFLLDKRIQCIDPTVENIIVEATGSTGSLYPSTGSGTQNRSGNPQWIEFFRETQRLHAAAALKRDDVSREHASLDRLKIDV